MAGLIALLVGYLMTLIVRRNGSKIMRYKYIICIACNNNKLKKCVWCGSDFTQEELAYMQKEALGYFNVIVEEQKLFRTNVVVQLVKAETDNWYWNTKKVVIEQEINY